MHTAIDQTRERNYPQVLSEYGQEILLVGITYQVQGKKHICKIEKLVT